MARGSSRLPGRTEEGPAPTAKRRAPPPAAPGLYFAAARNFARTVFFVFFPARSLPFTTTVTASVLRLASSFFPIAVSLRRTGARCPFFSLLRPVATVTPFFLAAALTSLALAPVTLAADV